MSELKLPVRNVRRTDPHCCMTCAFFEFPGDGTARCIRPKGPEWDASDQEYLYTVCNMWRSHLHHPLRTDDPAGRLD